MKEKSILTVMSLLLTVSLTACSGGEQESPGEVRPARTEEADAITGNPGHSSQTPENGPEKEAVLSLPDAQETESSISDEGKVKGVDYSVLTYTGTPDQNSSVSIQYPFFEGEGKGALNDLILAEVQELAQLDCSMFPEGTGLTIDYQTRITLRNDKIISMIFWGTGSVSGGAYETTDLIPFNIDLQTMEEVSFEDLYRADDDFRKVFFEKAYFPTDPIMSCEESDFTQMLQLQSPEYQPLSPFDIPGNVRCYLKQDALVLVMPAVHAVGGDYFEAQIDYDEIEDFYLPGQKDWTSSEVRSAVTVSNDVPTSAGEGRQDVKAMDSVEKRMLWYGLCELGSGWWLYTVPEQENQDYKMYFFADRSKDVGHKSFEDMDFDLGQADYVFPDARENNGSIGKFTDMYLCEPFVMESGEPAWIVAATYERDGRLYYDTRIYKWSGKEYVIDEAMTEALNALYSDVEEYPVLDIIEMPCG